MQIESLCLKNFRNFSDAKFNFGKSTVVRGPNGSGKSSILEAVSLLSTTKSIRAEHDVEMIKIGEEIASVSASISDIDRDLKLGMVIMESEKYRTVARKKVKLNGIPKTLNSFAGNLTSVIFTPTDLEIITGGPSRRRRFLDMMLAQTDGSYRMAHTNLNKVIKSRNKLLEKIHETGKGREELNFWNEEFKKESKVLQDLRTEFFKFAKESLRQHGSALNDTGTKYEAVYLESPVSDERLESLEDREIAAKLTLIGPNRDDFSIKKNGFDLESFGSRGEQRTAVLALKTVELDFISQKTKARPVLLLDDIFSELDEAHKEKVASITKLQQTIVTSTDFTAFENDENSIIKLG